MMQKWRDLKQVDWVICKEHKNDVKHILKQVDWVICKEHKNDAEHIFEGVIGLKNIE